MVGPKIKKYLAQKGISQTWLAAKTHINLNMLNAALNGARKLPIDEYQLIIWALELEPGEFLEQKEPEAAADGKA